jgi:hypothetical protein
MPTPIRKARIRTETCLLGALKRDGERGRERGLADERRLLLPTGGAAATARRPLSATAAAISTTRAATIRLLTTWTAFPTAMVVLRACRRTA